MAVVVALTVVVVAVVVVAIPVVKAWHMVVSGIM